MVQVTCTSFYQPLFYFCPSAWAGFMRASSPLERRAFDAVLAEPSARTRNFKKRKLTEIISPPTLLRFPHKHSLALSTTPGCRLEEEEREEEGAPARDEIDEMAIGRGVGCACEYA